jgi:CDP-glycerol glycerophosphotransferase (TagB/SpsB family)
MKERGGFDIHFTCTDEKERRWLFFQRSLRHEVETSLEAEGLATTRQRNGYDVVITGDIFRDASEYGDALLCFVNHGTGMKTILYRLLERHKDTRYIIFVEGEYRRRKINEFGVLGSSEVFVVGYPKLDPIFRGRFGREQVMRQWRLDPGKKTVLFAPTYKPTCIKDIREKILPATIGYNLIIKLHHYSWRGKYAPHWHHKMYERAVGFYNHARLIPPDEHSILPFIHVADTMISEASSTIFEFLALGKVGIIFDLDCDRLKHHDGMPLLDEDNRRFLDGAFVHINSPEQIRGAIRKALSPSADMRKSIERYRRELFYRLDGNASDRIVDTIQELIRFR